MNPDAFTFPQYKSWTLEQASTRNGALDILTKPSRIANTLFYPNGDIKYDPQPN